MGVLYYVMIAGSGQSAKWPKFGKMDFYRVFLRFLSMAILDTPWAPGGALRSVMLVLEVPLHTRKIVGKPVDIHSM